MRYLPPPLRPPSKHFSWNEVIGYGRSGYRKVPIGPFRLPNGKWVFPRAKARAHAANMERLRSRVNYRRDMHKLEPTGIKVLSWARSWEHNRAVGGAADSQHLYFGACDISLQEIDRLYPWKNGRKDFDVDIDRLFTTGGVGNYPAGNRHVDSRGYHARWTSFIPGR